MHCIEPRGAFGRVVNHTYDDMPRIKVAPGDAEGCSLLVRFGHQPIRDKKKMNGFVAASRSLITRGAKPAFGNSVPVSVMAVTRKQAFAARQALQPPLRPIFQSETCCLTGQTRCVMPQRQGVLPST